MCARSDRGHVSVGSCVARGSGKAGPSSRTTVLDSSALSINTRSASRFLNFETSTIVRKGILCTLSEKNSRKTGDASLTLADREQWERIFPSCSQQPANQSVLIRIVGVGRDPKMHQMYFGASSVLEE
jgi:hypothetical protein